MQARFAAKAFVVALFASLVLVLVLVGVGQSGGQGVSQSQGTPQSSVAPRGQILGIPAVSELRWLVPESAKMYERVDGERMKGYVEELAAISRRSRDAGNQYWGRIVGKQSSKETQDWVAAKLRQAGLEVRVEEYPLSPRVEPKSWEVRVESRGKALTLTSASPLISFARHIPAPEGDLQLDTVWVGLGTESDFMGKDVRGKAVFLYSVATPSSLIQSAAWMGGAERAQKSGAKALFVVLAIPGNLSFVSHLSGAALSNDVKLPIFTVGLRDGEAVESLNAASSGQGVTTRVRWEVETITGTAANVIGVLPGRTDENIVMLTHTDGFFEAATDNGAGTASLIGTAEYFAAIPREQRRRNMYFIAVPDHHGGNLGGAWVHQNMQDVLRKTAVSMNSEHVGAAEPVWDRAWGSGGPPELIPSNQLASSWWGVYGSDRLGYIVRDAFALFGVPTQIAPGGSAGQLRSVQWDAPSFYLHNKNVFYHASNDTPDAVRATGLRTAVQAFAKIFDDVNKLELKDLQPSAGHTRTDSN